MRQSVIKLFCVMNVVLFIYVYFHLSCTMNTHLLSSKAHLQNSQCLVQNRFGIRDIISNGKVSMAEMCL